MIFKQGDIILMPFPYTDAKAAKKRPALIISNIDHHDNYGKYVCIAITSKKPTSKWYHYTIVKWQEANLVKPSHAVIDKVFSTD